MATLEDIGARIGALAERLGPSIVGLARGSGRGSGVVIGDGRVLTAARAVRGDEVALVADDDGELAGVHAAGGMQRVADHGQAADGVQDLGGTGLHPGTGTCS